VSERITLVINDREVQAEAGARLIDVITETTGERVPRFCYHRDLPVAGSCRMCQVEVESMGPGGVARKALAISCRTPVSPGMKVWTHSLRAEKARRGVLEFLLKDHPLDCPICDKAGECPLQNFTFGEGQAEGRSHDPRGKRRKRVSLGDVIVLDEERCVLCTRCVRYFPAMEGRAQLQVTGLGHRSTIATFEDQPLEGNYQGNLADICPVGALTLKKFRFQARSWNLHPVPSTCTRCSRGCAVTVDGYRGGVVRIRPRYDAEVNRSWMCDHGRFAFDDLNQPGRLAAALDAGAAPPRALDLDEGLRRAAAWLAAESSAAFLLASPYLTLEEGRAFGRLAQAVGTTPFFLAPPVEPEDGILWTGDPCPNRRGLEEEGLRAIGPEKARRRLEEAPASFLAGEKILAFLHGLPPTDPGREIPVTRTGAHAVVMDTHPREGFALNLPARTWIEKHGRIRNREGLERVLRMVLAPPPGVPAGEELFDRLTSLIPAGAAL